MTAAQRYSWQVRRYGQWTIARPMLGDRQAGPVIRATSMPCLLALIPFWACITVCSEGAPE